MDPRTDPADSTPDLDDPAASRGAIIGGALMLLVTAAGLFLTFRSLMLERRNRRRRLRLRGQREPRDSDE